MGSERDSRAIFRDQNLERYQGAATQIRLGLGYNVSKIPENIAQLFDCPWGPVRAVKVKFKCVQM